MKLVNTITLNDADLNTLPAAKAVYAIYGLEKGHGRFASYKYVGSTDNLRESIVSHFSESETNKYLREFMQSDLTKILLFRLLPNRSKEEILLIEQKWIRLHIPECIELTTS